MPRYRVHFVECSSHLTLDPIQLSAPNPLRALELAALQAPNPTPTPIAGWFNERTSRLDASTWSYYGRLYSLQEDGTQGYIYGPMCVKVQSLGRPI